MYQHSARKLLFYFVSDTLLVLLAMALSSFLRVRLDIGAEGPNDAFATPPPLFVLAAVIWLFALNQVEAYKAQRHASLALELQNILVGHVVASLLFWGCLYITYRDYSRLQSVYFIVLTVALLVAHRVVVRLAYRVSGHAISERRPVIIVGATDNARAIGDTVVRHAWAGLDLLGYVRFHADREPDAALNRPVLGTIDVLERLVTEHAVKDVIVALKWFDPAMSAHITDIVNRLQHQSVNIRLAPDYSELAYFHVSTQDFGGVPLIGIREPVLTPYQSLVKRLFDLVFSTLALIVCAPLFLVIALAIRLDSPGAILLRQQRIGQHGRRFLMFKFRSMYAEPEKPVVPVGDTFTFIKVRDDPRVTRVGHFLRRTSLDELPQFVNVLLGDMSIVGPRPEVPWMVERYEWWQRKRFEVPQGMTGWWQIQGRADRPMYLHTDDDLFYIRHYSLLLDLRIILRTAFVVLSGRGAY